MNHAEYINRCEETYGYISDASKDAQGFRHRFDYTQYTLVQLEMQADEWTIRVIDAIEERKQDEARAIVEFEATITSTIEIGAGDRDTAVRWLRDAWKDEHNYGYWDSSYFNYEHGLPYDYDIDKGEFNSILSYLN